MGRTSKISQKPRDKTKHHHRGVLFLQAIPHSTKAAFKAACAQRDQTMRDAILLFMRDYVAKTPSITLKVNGKSRRWVAVNDNPGIPTIS